jgi:hypothetical protein
MNVYMSLPHDLKVYNFCTIWCLDIHGCRQPWVFGRAMDWAMYMSKLWQTSSASYSINTHLHLKLRFSAKFLAAQDNPYKSRIVSKVGLCGQFALLQAIFPLVFQKRCRVFWTVICNATCLLFLPIRWQVCHILWNVHTNGWVHVCRRACTNVCFVSGLISERVIHLICRTADRWQWHLFQQSSKRPIDAGRSAPRLAHPAG